MKFYQVCLVLAGCIGSTYAAEACCSRTNSLLEQLIAEGGGGGGGGGGNVTEAAFQYWSNLLFEAELYTQTYNTSVYYTTASLLNLISNELAGTHGGISPDLFDLMNWALFTSPTYTTSVADIMFALSGTQNASLGVLNTIAANTGAGGGDAYWNNLIYNLLQYTQTSNSSGSYTTASLLRAMYSTLQVINNALSEYHGLVYTDIAGILNQASFTSNSGYLTSQADLIDAVSGTLNASQTILSTIAANTDATTLQLETSKPDLGTTTIAKLDLLGLFGSTDNYKTSLADIAQGMSTTLNTTMYTTKPTSVSLTTMLRDALFTTYDGWQTSAANLLYAISGTLNTTSDYLHGIHTGSTYNDIFEILNMGLFTSRSGYSNSVANLLEAISIVTNASQALLSTIAANTADGPSGNVTYPQPAIGPFILGGVLDIPDAPIADANLQVIGAPLNLGGTTSIRASRLYDLKMGSVVNQYSIGIASYYQNPGVSSGSIAFVDVGLPNTWGNKETSTNGFWNNVLSSSFTAWSDGSYPTLAVTLSSPDLSSGMPVGDLYSDQYACNPSDMEIVAKISASAGVGPSIEPVYYERWIEVAVLAYDLLGDKYRVWTTTVYVFSTYYKTGGFSTWFQTSPSGVISAGANTQYVTVCVPPEAFSFRPVLQWAQSTTSPSAGALEQLFNWPSSVYPTPPYLQVPYQSRVLQQHISGVPSPLPLVTPHAPSAKISYFLCHLSTINPVSIFTADFGSGQVASPQANMVGYLDIVEYYPTIIDKDYQYDYGNSVLSGISWDISGGNTGFYIMGEWDGGCNVPGVTSKSPFLSNAFLGIYLNMLWTPAP